MEYLGEAKGQRQHHEAALNTGIGRIQQILRRGETASAITFSLQLISATGRKLLHCLRGAQWGFCHDAKIKVQTKPVRGQNWKGLQNEYMLQENVRIISLMMPFAGLTKLKFAVVQSLRHSSLKETANAKDERPERIELQQGIVSLFLCWSQLSSARDYQNRFCGSCWNKKPLGIVHSNSYHLGLMRCPVDSRNSDCP